MRHAGEADLGCTAGVGPDALRRNGRGRGQAADLRQERSAATAIPRTAAPARPTAAHQDPGLQSDSGHSAGRRSDPLFPALIGHRTMLAGRPLRRRTTVLNWSA